MITLADSWAPESGIHIGEQQVWTIYFVDFVASYPASFYYVG